MCLWPYAHPHLFLLPSAHKVRDFVHCMSDGIKVRVCIRPETHQPRCAPKEDLCSSIYQHLTNLHRASPQTRHLSLSQVRGASQGSPNIHFSVGYPGVISNTSDCLGGKCFHDTSEGVFETHDTFKNKSNGHKSKCSFKYFFQF